LVTIGDRIRNNPPCRWTQGDRKFFEQENAAPQYCGGRTYWSAVKLPIEQDLQNEVASIRNNNAAPIRRARAEHRRVPTSYTL
jgi:hypothetical protein